MEEADADAPAPSTGGAAAGSAVETAAPAAAPPSCHVPEGAWVLLLLSSGEQHIVRAKRGTKARIGRLQFSLDPVLAAPFGWTFVVEVRGNQSSLVSDGRTVEELSGSLTDTFADLVAQPDEGVSNAKLVDDSTAQELSQGDVKRLKTGGASGADVVRALASSSKTFAEKTAFSQEKYLRKKAKKHMVYLTAARPTALALLDMMVGRGPDKVLHLRRDTYALMLTLSNLQPGGRALVVEGAHGLLAGGAVQRLGGEGAVLATSVGHNEMAGVGWLNLSDDEMSTYRRCTLLQLLMAPPADGTAAADGAAAPAAAEGGGEAAAGEAAAAAATATAEGEAAPAPAQAEGGAAVDSGSADAGTSASDASAAGAPRAPRRRVHLTDDGVAEWTAGGFSSLLIATREPPLPMLESLLGRLRPSGAFAVYNQSLPYLAECLDYCHRSRCAVRLQLLESWARSYQVAPERTHPHMNAYPPTGYVLAGVKVVR